ncbi:MAG: APC family permease [Gammaproteobacteria bacterium]|nr:APC family permease [Gammaproteobacteria bacterium]
MTKPKKLGIFTLIMLMIGAVDSIRNLPATALFGTSLIFFFILAAMIFLVPAALVSAQLSARAGDESGIFHWTRAVLGEQYAFIAVWLQWISNLVWFPTILSFIAGSAAWLISPDLAQNRIWLISIILGIFWFLTLLNLRGIRVSAQFASFCAVTGLIIPIILILICTMVWMILGNPSYVHFTWQNMMPNLNDPQNWISLTAIMTAFLGIELAAVHAKDIKHPQRSFPIALFFSVALILVTMISGALAIAIIEPRDKISLVNGVLQTFNHFFITWHLTWAMPLITIMIILGTSGGIVSWVISPIRGLLHAGRSGFLPEFLLQKNRNNVASTLLIGQAILVTLFCTAFLWMPSVNGSYWLLTALSTQMYILMYVILFIAGIFSYDRLKNPEATFSIPGKRVGLTVVCLIGLFGCLITEVVGFLPPATINVGSTLRYEVIFTSAMALIILPAILLCFYRNRKLKQLNLMEEYNVSG